MIDQWIVETKEDEFGNIVLPIPQELIDQYGWQEGDELDFTVEDDSIVVKNVSLDNRQGKIA